MDLKQQLASLVNRFQIARIEGKLNNASEETIRTWINELLAVFGWDVQDTCQVLQERTLDRDKREKLKQIGSTNIRPDYTLVNGNVMLSFVDAKSLDVNVTQDKDAAFQIRSYGWSIGAPFAIVTNFAQLAIYDCSYMPHIDDDASIARMKFYTCDEFIDQVDMLSLFLGRTNLICQKISFVARREETLDKRFSTLLRSIRLDLANSIKNNNQHTSLDVISSYIQIIINRVLFIRVCESRGLEEEGLLKTFVQNGFWESFKACSYLNFYEHYDGPMFKRISDLQKIRIDDDVFARFISNLYYPSPYRFDVIPLKTLNDMYDLFLGYKLDIKDGILVNQLKTEFKKSNGAITTPKYIVDKVIENTISNELINGYSVKEFLDLKIIDPACGSGVFLVGVYDYLSSYILKWATTHKEEVPSFIFFDRDQNPILTIEGRKKIINSCIYGVDINPEAVEVAKMALSLKIIDNYAPEYFESVGLYGAKILNGIGENIKCGNSLVDSDILELTPQIQNNLEEYSHTNVFSWANAYQTIIRRGGFDYVIGNPPYVEVKNYNIGLPSMAKYIKKKYHSCKKGKVDLAMPFVEKGLALLNEHGRLGYIVQKRFFKTEYGEALREDVTTKNHLIHIHDYSETDIFEGVITYVAILVCGNNTNDYVKFTNSAELDFNIPKAYIDKRPWNFDNPELWQLARKLATEKGILENTCSIQVGIQVLWGDAYQIKVTTIRDGLIYGKNRIDDNIVIEEAACRPLLCNEKILPFAQPDFMTYALFPYDIQDGVATRISFSEYTNMYPRAGAYLMKHRTLISNTVQLQPDRVNGLDREEFWHVYTRESHLGDEAQKVCIPMTSKEPIATYLHDEKVYCDNANMFYLRFKNETEDRMYALAAIINSTPFSMLARLYANPQQNGYFKFSRQFLNPIPFPCKTFDDEKCPEMLELATIGKKIDEIQERIKTSRLGIRDNFNILLHQYFNRIDEICCDLYGVQGDDRILLMSHNREDRYDKYDK